MSLPSVPAAKFLFCRYHDRNGDVESLPAAPVDPLTAVRPRPTGMLKPQLTLLLQLNRCQGCPACYKNDNRVTPTRQRKSTHGTAGIRSILLRDSNICASRSLFQCKMSL